MNLTILLLAAVTATTAVPTAPAPAVAEPGALPQEPGLSALPAGPAPGVYKWVDREGVTRYDDRASDKAPRMTRDDIEGRRIPDTPTWLGTVPVEIVEEAQLKCQIAREREVAYTSARTLYGRDPGGNVYPLSPAQVQLEVATARRDGDRYCGTQGALNLQAEKRAAQEQERRRAEAAAPKYKVIPVERR